MKLKTLAAALVLSFVLPFAASAVEPNEILKDPALEARAREVGKGLRCVVCQNQSIDDSNAELARDMRVLVRDRIVAGDTNDEVMAYMVDRYGDFVLLNPPFKTSTYVLWIGPAIIAGLGLVAVLVFFRRRTKDNGASPEVKAKPSGLSDEALSDEERARLDKLLKDNDA